MKEAKSMSITPVLECLKTGKLILSSWDNGYSWVVHDWKGHEEGLSVPIRFTS